ncbi:hypothetical protein ACLKA6_003602 [Drosophila palustris]
MCSDCSIRRGAEGKRDLEPGVSCHSQSCGCIAAPIRFGPGPGPEPGAIMVGSFCVGPKKHIEQRMCDDIRRYQDNLLELCDVSL